MSRGKENDIMRTSSELMQRSMSAARACTKKKLVNATIKNDCNPLVALHNGSV